VNVILYVVGLPVGPGTRGSWDSQLLKIPPVSPSIMNCGVMKVDYFVKVIITKVQQHIVSFCC